MSKQNYLIHNNKKVPLIQGGFGGGGSRGGSFSEADNDLFSTDVMYVLSAIGEGPIYRINPNGPQDIEISDSSIDDLVKIEGNGQENTEVFKTLSTTGTVTQAALTKFGEQTVTPQTFASPVNLKKGNVDGVPKVEVVLQDTSAEDWDELKFNFIINALQKQKNNGDIVKHSLTVRVRVFDRTGTTVIKSKSKTVEGKTTVPYKFSIVIQIPKADRSTSGYKFSIDKTSDESTDSRVQSNVQSVGWNEIKNDPQAYPRTALIGYALKAFNEHQGGVPNFTSLVKGLIVKVPSNYNQPILTNGQIDWRELELAESGVNGYSTNGYSLQKSGTDTKLTDANPQIYIGTWDGTFVYSWTQNPVWIIYDILTNKTYGLGIEEENIDKYKFYQVAQYCDACDEITGNFIGVDGQADGSFRHKPRDLFTAVKETLIGVSEGSSIKERRFTCDILIADQSQSLEVLQSICASFRASLVQSFGKISIAIDRPDQFPSMVFNETNIKSGSFQIGGGRESDVITGVEVSYVEPTNHYKRETARIDSVDANDGSLRAAIENIQSLDLPGVTRRSQALRFAQYQIAASRYLRRTVAFTTSTEALNLAPGDLISVSQNMTGINYGFGGKVSTTSSVEDTDANVILEHFTSPSLQTSTFTSNTAPLALRIVGVDDERIDLYIVSNTDFTLDTTDNVSVGIDLAELKITGRFNPITKQIDSVTSWGANNVPTSGDLWSLGEWENPGNYYTNKAGKLFTVAELEREPDGEVNIVAKEYVSNVYVDSDTFIDYTPTAYIDIESPFAAPPPPVFSFEKQVRRKADGSIVFDGFIDNKTDRLGYIQKFKSEYFVAVPEGSTLINNTSINPLTLTVDNSSAISDGSIQSTITGKAGFTSFVGEIRLLCNAYSTVDNGDGTSNVRLVVEGLNVCFDENIFKHVLEVNDDAVFLGLKGDDYVTVPLKEKTSKNSLKNFIAFADDTVEASANIVAFDKTVNTIDIENITTGSTAIVSLLADLPFEVKINQVLDSRFFDNSSFYISGTEKQFEVANTFGDTYNGFIELPVRPRDKKFIDFYVDGIQKSAGQFTFNKNDTTSLKANIGYTTSADDVAYRVEINHYTVPTIEVGDNVKSFAGNVFSVINTSFDPASAAYNAALTANSIYRIQLSEQPKSNLFGASFVNISQNPIGTINNVSSNTCTFDYDTSIYPGNFNLANSGVYDLQVSSEYNRLFLAEDQLIRDLGIGVTSIRSRNINAFRRASPFVEKSLSISPIPIQKVQEVSIIESLYREQTGGVAVRVTLSFDHITGQEVTDYEISYRIAQVEAIGSDDAGSELTSFNTVKVSAAGVEDDGKIRFTVYGINRGATSSSNSAIFRITPLNKEIRGSTTTVEKTILGKTSKPLNIFSFTGGQQTDQITFFWEYERQNDELADLDLKEVVIKRIQGTVEPSLENFVLAIPYVTVAAGVNRKSVPIDQFGTFTYLARTRDTSGNFSDDVVSIALTTSRPQRTTVVAAYNEDSPTTAFTLLTNRNSDEENFPSFANSNNGGLSYPSQPSSLVDNANGTSTGYSAIAGSPTDLLADGSATYITQIRDFGATITGQLQIDIQGTQAVQSTWNDQHEHIIESVTEVGEPTNNIVVDSSFGGIGHLVGFSNAQPLNFRFDSNNQTLMSGGSSGNVYALHLHGNYENDESNANVFALIAGSINANAIALGETFFANGESTGGNTYANLAVAGTSYYLVDLKQFSDFGSTETFAGDLGALSTQVFVRTTTEDNTILYYANGNVNVAAFGSTGVNDEFIPYEAGTRTFRQFQIKFVVNNTEEDQFDFTIDQFRYTVDKEQTIFSNTVAYNNTTVTVDYTDSKYLSRPVIGIQPIDTATSQTAVVTFGSNNEVNFKLFDVEAGTAVPTDQGVEVQITATGV